MQSNNDIKMINENKKISIEDFTLITVLGKGSYAKVILVRKKDNNKIYAMKVIKKKTNNGQKQQEHIITERNVLVGLNNQFICKLYYSFQNERKFFFVLEYCPGGELFNLLVKKKRFTEDQTRFYAAQIILALEHVHSQDIIYRDLKPENVLIDQNGYIRITDFGLSKTNIKANTGAYSVCGTPEYLAPEILMKMGHGKAADWWTLGAIIYEMLTGMPPFYTQNRNELFERIKFGQLMYPNWITNAAKHLLESLFNKNPAKRLGTQGANEIKAHPFFAVVNWDDLINNKINPPFVPIIKSETDVTNFDNEFTEQPIDSFSDGTILAANSMNQKFPNFTFDADLQMQQE